MSKIDKIVDDVTQAEMLGWRVEKLRQLRSDGKPVPNYIKFSRRCVRTKISEIEKFINKYTVLGP